MVVVCPPPSPSLRSRPKLDLARVMNEEAVAEIAVNGEIGAWTYVSSKERCLQTGCSLALHWYHVCRMQMSPIALFMTRPLVRHHVSGYLGQKVCIASG